MADDWEDWEKEDFEPPPPAVAPTAKAADFETAGAAILAKMNQVDESKFADEDADEEEPEEGPVQKSQPRKERRSDKWGVKGQVQDVPLDDPVAEKLRRQRLVEEADYQAAKELFGGGGGGSGLSPLDTMLPKSSKDMEEFATLLANRYILPHAEAKSFKVLIKTLVKLGCAGMSSADVKEVEDAAGLVRVERQKVEQAAKQTKSKKATVNVGKGGLSAGLDDFKYADDYGDDDFM